MSAKVVAFIQARMTSKRLPGKVLAMLAGEPMLAKVISRTSRARTLDETWVLTSTDESDDAIERFCSGRSVPCFRGSLDDVLGRFADAARIAEPDIVVRITADCPLVDPGVIDKTVDVLLKDQSIAYAATRMPNRRTFPVGIDVEAFWCAGLGEAAKNADQPYQREHVTPWFYDGSQSGPIVHVQTKPDLGEHRWTVDTPDDLAFMRALWPRLPSEWVGYEDIAAIVEADPELRAINADVAQRHYQETSD